MAEADFLGKGWGFPLVLNNKQIPVSALIFVKYVTFHSCEAVPISSPSLLTFIKCFIITFRLKHALL